MDFVPQLVEIDNLVQPGKKIQIEQSIPLMFLKTHYDPKDPLKIKYPAKVRAPRTLWKEVPPVAEPRLDKLYEFLDGLREKEKATRAGVRAS